MPPARCRAARIAHSVLLDALSWMTPLPRNSLGQVHLNGQPVEDVLLQFGDRGAGVPQHALGAEARRHQIGQRGGPAGVGREVGEEARGLPMGNAGQYDLIEIGQHLGKVLAVLRRLDRQHGPDVARLDRGLYRQFPEPRHVVGHPVHCLVAPMPELLRGHVVGSLSHECHCGRQAAATCW